MSDDRIPRVEDHLETIQNALALAEMVARMRYLSGGNFTASMDEDAEDRAWSALTDTFKSANKAMRSMMAVFPAQTGFIDAPEVK